ncbi:unnamed protein product [Rhodiola kirilowii]
MSPAAVCYNLSEKAIRRKTAGTGRMRDEDTPVVAEVAAAPRIQQLISRLVKKLQSKVQTNVVFYQLAFLCKHVFDSNEAKAQLRGSRTVDKNKFPVVLDRIS